MSGRIHNLWGAAVFAGIAAIELAQPSAVAPLRLEKVIPLEGVEGRIDHLSIDVPGRRLFVSALGNNTVEVIDLRQARRTGTIRGLAEPQGVLYLPSGRLFVANGNDGSVRLFDGSSLQPLKTVPYGDDADNLRFAGGHVWVGYGSGALGELDPEGAKVADIQLDAHPESFQFEKDGPRIFVNLPDSHKIAVVDRTSRKVIASWRAGGPGANFPMALDEAHRRLFVVCRKPARLVVFDTDNGLVVANLPAIGDSDDVFYDAKRSRIYATGGEGGIAVYKQQDAGHYSEIGRIATVSGARTGFFSPDFDRLYVAAPAHGSAAASIRVYAPAE